MTDDSTPPKALASASVLLLRDHSPAPEVFMVQRHHQIDFATGALVFPGGKVEADDRDPRLRQRSPGADDLADEELAYRAAAVRETFEEAGVLLASERGQKTPIGASRRAELDTRYRDSLQAGRTTLADMVEKENLELRVRDFVPFAHWITPLFMPKRFETHFFVVEAPAYQAALHDGGEAVDSAWLSAEEALQQQERGQRKIIFPTLSQLQKLGRSRSVEEALQRARDEAVVTVLPWLETDDEGGSWLCLPEDAGYAVTRASLDNIA